MYLPSIFLYPCTFTSLCALCSGIYHLDMCRYEYICTRETYDTETAEKKAPATVGYLKTAISATFYIKIVKVLKNKLKKPII